MSFRMNKIKVMAVDDSPFSLEMLKNALCADDIEVCGLADGGKTAIAMYAKLQPDIVTMDMTMPDMDGLACSRELLNMDPQARIIMISSMRDEALIARGKIIGISAFGQKPFKRDQLLSLVRRVYAGARIDERQETYLAQFVQSVKENLLEMAGLVCELDVVRNHMDGIESGGMAVVIGITGNDKGKIVVDMSPETAHKITARILCTDEVTENQVINGLIEISNIICGNAVSRINNLFPGTEMRVTPPGILFGEKMHLFNPKLNISMVRVKTELGSIAISVGFTGEVQ